MSELEPHKRRKRDVAPRHIPQEIVPVPIDEVRDFVHDALTGTSLTDPIASYYAGWALFAARARYTAVDDTHTRIELDVAGTAPGAEILLFNQRRAAIDRFFVALQDELDRRERWGPRRPAVKPSLERAEKRLSARGEAEPRPHG